MVQPSVKAGRPQSATTGALSEEKASSTTVATNPSLFGGGRETIISEGWLLVEENCLDSSKSSAVKTCIQLSEFCHEKNRLLQERALEKSAAIRRQSRAQSNTYKHHTYLGGCQQGLLEDLFAPTFLSLSHRVVLVVVVGGLGPLRPCTDGCLCAPPLLSRPDGLGTSFVPGLNAACPKDTNIYCYDAGNQCHVSQKAIPHSVGRIAKMKARERIGGGS